MIFTWNIYAIHRTAEETRRSKTAIENIIKSGLAQKRSGAKSKLSQRDRRRIIYLAT